MSKLTDFVRDLWEAGEGFLFPQSCVGCGKNGMFLCLACQESLPRINPPFCPRCGRQEWSGELCPSCLRRRLEAIDGIRSPFRFEGLIRQAIHQFKYRNVRTAGPPLARLMAGYLAANPLPGDSLVPVPLHKRRLRERGYNQSLILAQELGKLTGIEMIDFLVRLKDTPPQARAKSFEARQENVAAAFAVQRGVVRGRKIILVDDVSTTGETLNSCAAALKSAGCACVWGLTLAREM